MVEPATQTSNAIGELVRESALPSFERRGCVPKRAVEASPAFSLESNREGRGTAGRNCVQSSIPVVGEDGTAISRAGMRPAR